MSESSLNYFETTSQTLMVDYSNSNQVIAPPQSEDETKFG
jgi:hypothetical protein